MAKIRVLSNHLIQRIAAGQVVDRPAAVVKELVENALDAGASAIDITLQAGGREKIVVLDDGQGMVREDLERAALPHTTSKLRTVEDLQSIVTFGFRGEALASMAAVARLTVASRAAGQPHGYQLVLQDGSLVQPIKPLGMPVGTQVVVEQLFARVPARQKFLKSAQSEYRAVLAVVVQLSMAHPQVRFSLSHNGLRTLTLPAAADAVSRFRVFTALAELDEVSSIKLAAPHVAGTLYILPPSRAERAYKNQFIFVNHRPVQYPSIVQAVKAAYATLLEPKAVPVFLLDITLDHGLVDVNVDPTKSTVRFAHTDAVMQAIRDAANQLVAVHSQGNRPQFSAVQKEYGMDESLAEQFRAEIKPWMPAADVELDLSHIMQIAKTYLGVPAPEGLLLVDQHAAHESILYQQLRSVHTQQKTKLVSEKLAVPQTFELPLLHWQTLHEQAEQLKRAGFSLEFNAESHALTVTAIPQFLSGYPLLEYFIELAGAEDASLDQLDQTTHRTISYVACRTAVKAGDTLTLQQRRELIEKAREVGAVTCPHGRPTQVLLSVEQLEKLFHRR